MAFLHRRWLYGSATEVRQGLRAAKQQLEQQVKDQHAQLVESERALLKSAGSRAQKAKDVVR